MSFGTIAILSFAAFIAIVCIIIRIDSKKYNKLLRDNPELQNNPIECLAEYPMMIHSAPCKTRVQSLKVVLCTLKFHNKLTITDNAFIINKNFYKDCLVKEEKEVIDNLLNAVKPDIDTNGNYIITIDKILNTIIDCKISLGEYMPTSLLAEYKAYKFGNDKKYKYLTHFMKDRYINTMESTLKSMKLSYILRNCNDFETLYYSITNNRKYCENSTAESECRLLLKSNNPNKIDFFIDNILDCTYDDQTDIVSCYPFD